MLEKFQILQRIFRVNITCCVGRLCLSHHHSQTTVIVFLGFCIVHLQLLTVLRIEMESYIFVQMYLQHEVLIGLQGETNIIRHFSRLCVLRPSKHYLALQWGKNVVLRSQYQWS